MPFAHLRWDMATLGYFFVRTLGHTYVQEHPPYPKQRQRRPVILSQDGDRKIGDHGDRRRSAEIEQIGTDWGSR